MYISLHYKKIKARQVVFFLYKIIMSRQFLNRAKNMSSTLISSLAVEVYICNAPYDMWPDFRNTLILYVSKFELKITKSKESQKQVQTD